eukprot:jgi/Psemu1/282873/fgenesh1_pg.15_\
MFPVLHPSMCDGDSRADNDISCKISKSSDDLRSDGGSDLRSDGGSDLRLHKNKNKNKNETSIASKPTLALLHRMKARIRSHLMTYRRHRYFRRSLFLLWVMAVFVSIHANWLAWTGDTIMESFAIATTPPVDICFITAQYASSTDQLDNLVNLREEAPRFFSDRHKDHYHFFAFTNRRDWIDKASQSSQTSKSTSKSKSKKAANNQGGAKPKENGWTILVQEFPPERFQRFITQSRWPKFQGFRHEQIVRSCDVVFYMDGTVLPIGSPWKFQTEARRILNSGVQLSQELHPHSHEDGGGIAGEMERCRRKNKDIESNLKATLDWFHAQPDFTNDCQMYQNTFFGYAVQSPSFRMAANFAWGRFSQEKDSWRDQPLWCYTLHHFGITPLVIPGNIFQYQGERKGGNDHKYDESANNNAQRFYQTTMGKGTTGDTTTTATTKTDAKPGVSANHDAEGNGNGANTGTSGSGGGSGSGNGNGSPERVAA